MSSPTAWFAPRVVFSEWSNMHQYHLSRDMFEHANRLPGWHQQYDQLSSGPVHGVLQLVDIDGVRLFREQLNRAAMQAMRLPSDTVNIVLPLAWPQMDHHRDWLFDGLNLLPSMGDFQTITPAGMDVICISVPCAELRPLLDEEVMAICFSSSAVEGVPLETESYGLVRQELLALLELAAQRPDNLPTLGWIRQRLIEWVAHMLEGYGSQAQPLPNQSTRHYIVNRCHRLIMDDLQTPLNVLDLCRKLKISRRTLQYSFQSVADVTPIQYLRSVRLNEARRTMLLDPETQIADLAARVGFNHSSYFCLQYQKLFGETPSSTRHRAPI
jgi:AraC-like DNA-binding protein